MTTLSAQALVLDPREYAEARPALRAQMIPLRRLRRVRLGDMLAVEFENPRTLTYQVQEMVFAEGVRDADGVAHELAAYSRLLPSSHTLTATLFVELDDTAAVRDELARLGGVQHALRIEVDGHVVPATEIPGPDEDGPTAETFSVHFVRFTFDDAARDAFRDPAVPATLVVDHPAYAEEVSLTGETRTSLLADLALPPA